MRKVTRQVAAGPGGWTPERAAKVTTLFDTLASDWNSRDHPGRLEPLRDAFARGVGALTRPGRCLELGSGTGLATPWLAERFVSVVAVDLSQEMLRRAPESAGPRICADAARLPVPDQAADCAVLINALLFPSEIDRVLARDGVLVWVSTSGQCTPIYLAGEEVEAALPGHWEGRTSMAGQGTWTTLCRR